MDIDKLPDLNINCQITGCSKKATLIVRKNDLIMFVCNDDSELILEVYLRNFYKGL